MNDRSWRSRNLHPVGAHTKVEENENVVGLN